MKQQWVDTKKIFLNFGVSRYPKELPFNWKLVLFIMLYKVA